MRLRALRHIKKYNLRKKTKLGNGPNYREPIKVPVEKSLWTTSHV